MNLPDESKEQFLDGLVNHYGKEGALKVLSKMHGFYDLPPTVEEFVESKEFCGTFLGKGQLWKPWKRTLKQIFPNPLFSQYHEIAITGSIGIGKTEMACAGLLYDLCKLLYMECPQQEFRLGKATPLVIAFINATVALSDSVMWRKFNTWLNDTPFFVSQMNSVPRGDRRRRVESLPHHITFLNASRSRMMLGQGVFSGVASEINFMNEVVKDQAIQNYAQLKHRIISRFFRGEGMPYPGRMWLESSKTDETGFLETHMTSLNESNLKAYADGKPERNLIICKSFWEVKREVDSALYCGKNFKVFVGDQKREPFIPSAPGDYLGIPPELLIDVPIEHREEFERHLVRSINNLAGVSTWGSSRFLNHEDLVKEALSLDNAAMRPVVSLALHETDDQLINYVDVSKIPKDAPYFIHFDFGVTGCRTGICMTRSIGEVAVERHALLQNVMTRDSLYESPLIMAVQARPGSEIPLSRFRNFIFHLVERGVPIAGVSTDTFQSRQFLQECAEGGIQSVETISTVKQRDQYDHMKECILEHRWQGAQHDLLLRELLMLRDEGKLIGLPVGDGSATNEQPSKDIADAVAGSIWHCKLKNVGMKKASALDEYSAYMKTVKKEQTQMDALKEQIIKANRGNNMRRRRF